MRLTKFENIFKERMYCGIYTTLTLFFFPVDWWTSARHPDLGQIAELLYDMIQQLGPEYEYLMEPPRSTHRHEALRRLFLKAIVTLRQEAPITLDSSWRIALRSS